MKRGCKIFLSFVIVFHCGIFVSELNAQPLYWQRIYDLNTHKDGTCGVAAFDGGYLIVSEWLVGGDMDGINIIKTDMYGIVEWNKNYNTGTSEDIIQTNDSGFILVGGGLRASVFKINKLGDSL